MRRFAQIRDRNHSQIVGVLRACGVEVIETWRPLDLLIYLKDGRSGWVEVKTKDRNNAIQRTQIEFMSTTRMPVAFVTDQSEAQHFAETLEGITPVQKKNLAIFLREAKPRKQYPPTIVERVLKWEDPAE